MASEVDLLISKKTRVSPNLSANHIWCFCHKIALILNAGLKALQLTNKGLGQVKNRTGSDGGDGEGDPNSSDIPANGGSNIDTVLKKQPSVPSTTCGAQNPTLMGSASFLGMAFGGKLSSKVNIKDKSSITYLKMNMIVKNKRVGKTTLTAWRLVESMSSEQLADLKLKQVWKLQCTPKTIVLTNGQSEIANKAEQANYSFNHSYGGIPTSEQCLPAVEEQLKQSELNLCLPAQELMKVQSNKGVKDTPNWNIGEASGLAEQQEYINNKTQPKVGPPMAGTFLEVVSRHKRSQRMK
ncbi:hypothetical protein PGTUg99_029249 [Puccinia graminis f. sp. tritici]|uniref:Uncharacterized protein n=1 Tax=Puccinia graminis f. sp. tritici TaxID=56615 RepID=A0A5B0QT47_PUCGR|nr:hypothetical protein PGTUg99_029249 [Puccinia graminis f. sp. tritici]